jgi:hypothetical protein
MRRRMRPVPVVIQELVVRVLVEPVGGGSASPAEPRAGGGLSEEERLALIEAAVEETLRVLRRERER